MDYDKLLLTHKLENIMSSMQMKQVLDSMWGPENYEKDDKALKKFTVDFDLDSKEIQIKSKARNENGDPVYDWKLD